MKKDELHDELREHAPFLNELRQKDGGMRVPEGYFNNLEDEVFRQLDAIGARRQTAAFARTKAQRSWWQWAQWLWQPRMALAVAGVLALALAAWWYFGPSENAGPAIAETAISAEDAEAYLLSNPHEFEPEQIALVLPADELPPITLDHNAGNRNPAAPKNELQLSPDDLDALLRDMTDEELEELL